MGHAVRPNGGTRSRNLDPLRNATMLHNASRSDSGMLSSRRVPTFLPCRAQIGTGYDPIDHDGLSARYASDR